MWCIFFSATSCVCCCCSVSSAASQPRAIRKSDWYKWDRQTVRERSFVTVLDVVQRRIYLYGSKNAFIAYINLHISYCVIFIFRLFDIYFFRLHDIYFTIASPRKLTMPRLVTVFNRLYLTGASPWIFEWGAGSRCESSAGWPTYPKIS